MQCFKAVNIRIVPMESEYEIKMLEKETSYFCSMAELLKFSWDSDIETGSFQTLLTGRASLLLAVEELES